MRGLLHRALQVVLGQRQKRIAGVDRVSDFDHHFFNEAFDLCDYLKFFDEVDVARRLQLTDRGVCGPDGGGFYAPFRFGQVSGRGPHPGYERGSDMRRRRRPR